MVCDNLYRSYARDDESVYVRMNFFINFNIATERATQKGTWLRRMKLCEWELRGGKYCIPFQLLS